MALKGQLELENLSSDPASTVTTGQMYFNTSSNKVRVYNGTQWEDASSGSSGGGSVSVPQSGLVFHLDAGDTNSYSGSGSTWADLSGNGYNWNVNQSSFVSTGIQHFNFESGYRATYGSSSITETPGYTNRTIVLFMRVRNAYSAYMTAINAEQGRSNGDSAVKKFNNQWNVGPETNGFYQTYNMSNVSTYQSHFNGWFFRISTNSNPYYAVSLNGDTSNRATNSNSFAGTSYGPSCIGSISNGNVATYESSNNEGFGRFAAVLYYNRQITFAEQATIYNAYKTRFGI
jgi:hypothetical protein